MAYMRDAHGRRLDSFKVADARSDLIRHAPPRTQVRRVMTTPPTITVYSGNSTITGAAAPQIDPVTAMPDCLVGGAGWAHPTNGWNAASWWRTDRALDVNGLTVAGYKIMTYCDQAKYEASFYIPSGATYRVKVDDEYVTTTATSFGVAGATRWLQLDFGTAALRRIVIETTALPIGLNTSVTGTIWPARPRGPRVIAFGDSYTGGATGANGAAYTTWLSAMADTLGWEDIYQNAVGSTGYIATVGGQQNNTLAQVAKAVAAGIQPDVVIVSSGHNDNGTPTEIAAAAVPVYAAIRAAWPDALVVAAGPWFVGGAGQLATWAAREAAIFSAVDADVFIPQATGPGVPWFTGTGRVGATTGVGNSDAYVYSDAVHPTQAGHDYAGVRFAETLREALSS
ncbi:SGNH/GDSL hydrolase family protein [Microbacterium gilvum]|uniref:SGNH hydrolase-type esterase domain-containing protein n=1 Tax=Microbacterium gilvum TaxID=1336204 RepID=A0ABP9A7L7_9MICO